MSVPAWVVSLSERGLEHAGHPTAQVAEDSWQPRFFNEHQNLTVIALTDLIIPETDTPGAAEAGVNQFIDEVMAESDTLEQKNFTRGLRWVDRRSEELFGDPFIELPEKEQAALLTIMSADSSSIAERTGREFFSAIKALAITGYYTSEVGYFQELGNDGQMFFDDYLGSQESQAQIEQWLEESRTLRRSTLEESQE